MNRDDDEFNVRLGRIGAAAARALSETHDLEAFTRDLVTQMERDVGTRLDRIAVAHWNTDDSHVHLLVRGAGWVRSCHFP